MEPLVELLVAGGATNADWMLTSAVGKFQVYLLVEFIFSLENFLACIHVLDRSDSLAGNGII